MIFNQNNFIKISLDFCGKILGDIDPVITCFLVIYRISFVKRDPDLIHYFKS